MQGIEAMFGMLKSEGLGPRFIKDDSVAFERNIAFAIDGVEMFIEWWANVAYLSVGGRFVSCFAFTEIQIDTTWPSYQRGLRFVGEDGGGPMRVAIKKLGWQKKSGGGGDERQQTDRA